MSIKKLSIFIILFFTITKASVASNDSLKIVFSVDVNIKDVTQLKELLNADNAVSIKAFCDRQHSFLIYVNATAYNSKELFITNLIKIANPQYQIKLLNESVKLFAEKCEAFDSVEAERVKYIHLNE
ncbi:MAG: hypothetical protein IPM51_05970 [Sphingobacteriaceae bacterium]|nr:hypothetical protein [Sphingobacteriaceae bacterium]